MKEPDRPTFVEARFSLLDAGALIVGYSLASLLVRAYWPRGETPSFWAVSMITMVFLWLGLAMSGPVVLIIRRPRAVDAADSVEPPSRTWAELAWLIIGFYWIGLTVLVVPTRLDGSRFLDSAILGLFPILAALVIWWVGPRKAWATAQPQPGGPTWTHRAAVGLLLSWPFAWVGLIALGKAFL
ncbi:MAG: hypothetical protein AB7I30_15985 [Isosphaeraceae bacterium]